MLIDAKAFYDYDQRETGVDPAESFDDFDQLFWQYQSSFKQDRYIYR